ncbi:hypothetical protein FA10DRAFT_266236 [Acaromyces ingoldii]|uniref:Uncharacterized protein n=1 Tax=Acaromyces ingoldii TaxID=215250 RepID=A0A316YV12_9BASI|nr:hypothetical protein FA10DRAFT_266236 [Acaromyces ingoldii]PWN92478.1 hypothetical protein FA10DRAFT_266236 [Acaromyces ingoldii]
MKLSDEAYTTAILHAAKHPASSVTGLLVGGSTQSVERVVPLVHNWTDLAPMTEVASSLVEASLSSTEKIVGVYHAPASAIETSAAPSAVKLAQVVARKLSTDAVLLQVNNALLASTTAHALQPFSVSASGQVRSVPVADVALADGQASIERVKSEVAKGTWEHIVDFDDHLQDTSLNWLQQRPRAAVA